MDTYLEKAIQRAYDKFMSMSNDEFMNVVQAHVDGDVAQALLYSNALDVGEIEAIAFACPERQDYSCLNSCIIQIIETDNLFVSHPWTTPLAA